MKSRTRYPLILMLAVTLVALASPFVLETAASSPHLTATMPQTEGKRNVARLQPNSLCSSDEQIIFSCAVKRTAKLVSLCASPELTKDRGYLQYRFGLPGKVELEFPKDRVSSQAKFHYSHYFRFQVDLTEIKFAVDNYEYSVFDEYNGEEKPAISSQGVTVTAPGKSKDVSQVCRNKPKADYSSLQDALPNDSQ